MFLILVQLQIEYAQESWKIYHKALANSIIFIGCCLNMEMYIRVLVRSNIAQRQDNIYYITFINKI